LGFVVGGIGVFGSDMPGCERYRSLFELRRNPRLDVSDFRSRFARCRARQQLGRADHGHFYWRLAVFTARLWLSTNKLWSVTNKTLEHAERTTRKELRAYLSVEPLGINEYIGHNYLIGHFRVRNTGKIPAKDVSIYSTIALDADGKRTKFPIGIARPSPTVLQPGAEMEFGSYEGWEIPADQLDSNEPLKVRGYLYVWGEILYTDEFKTAGWTAFCHRYPCDMFGMTKRKEAAGRGLDNRRIHRKFARYHEEAGNDAG
jgi:hypothetical protein